MESLAIGLGRGCTKLWKNVGHDAEDDYRRKAQMPTNACSCCPWPDVAIACGWRQHFTSSGHAAVEGIPGAPAKNIQGWWHDLLTAGFGTSRQSSCLTDCSLSKLERIMPGRNVYSIIPVGCRYCSISALNPELQHVLVHRLPAMISWTPAQSHQIWTCDLPGFIKLSAIQGDLAQFSWPHNSSFTLRY